MNKINNLFVPVFASVFAFVPAVQGADFDGPYAGGGIGVFGSATAEARISGLSGYSDDSVKIGAEDILTKSDLILGYGKQFDNFYFGGEANYSFGFLDDQVAESDGTQLDVESNNGYGVAARGGYILTPETLAYVKLGYQQREFELSADGESAEEDFSGYVIGGGMAYQIPATPVSIRAEAARIDYGDESNEGIEAEPTETTVDLQAVYRF